MFTPPPSPQPTQEPEDIKSSPTDELPQIEHPSPSQVKRRIGRRTKWTVLLVPIILIFITASTRYLTHPAAFDIFSDSPPSWKDLASQGSIWRAHKRHAAFEPRSQDPPPSAPAPSNAPASSTPLPTIPTSTPTFPPIPSPFPQPYDSDVTQNFSSMSCFNFFGNMTNTAAFRSCRPFSLLFQTSAEFINAENNITLLNAIMWGTCNTTLPEEQCLANMGWFSGALESACVEDLLDKNAMVTDALTALQAYGVMRETGCVADPVTNSYCFINAVQSTNPYDLYAYQLPLGLSIPAAATPTCSACTKTVLGIYSSALENGTEAGALSGLKKTYASAAKGAIQKCGDDYALLITTIGAANGATISRPDVGLFTGIVAILAWTILGSLS